MKTPTIPKKNAPPAVLVNEKMESVVVDLDDHSLPPGLGTGVFDPGGDLETNYYYTTGVNLDNAEISSIGLSGFKSDLILNPPQTGFLNNRNIPFAWLALPNPERKTTFMDGYKRAWEKFLKEPPPPVKKIIESRIPTTISAHSTGGQIALEHAASSHNYGWLSDRFCGAVIQSPMLETAPLVNFAPEMQVCLFDWFATKNADKLPEETWPGRSHLWVCGEKYNISPDTDYIRPTYEQILAIRENGRRHITQKQGPSLLAKGDLPILFMLGNDKFADPKTNIDFARMHNFAVIFDPKSKHAPICENNRIMALYVKAMRAMGEGRFNEFAKAHCSYGEEQKNISDKVSDLGSGFARAARERSARLADSSARLTQRLFGGRIGNPEMGRQAKRRAVDTGNTLGL